MSKATETAGAFHVTSSSRVREADAATRLVHDGFVEAGFIAPRPSGRRLIGPYLNPGVGFAVCRSGRHDVATAIGITDGPFGLPADAAFPDLMSTLREQGEEVVEGGSLVVAPQWRRSRRRIMVLILAEFIRFAGRISPETNMVITMHPRDARFYRSFLGMSLLNDAPRTLFDAPADLGVSTWGEMMSFLRSSDGRLQRELLEATVDPDPGWLTTEPFDKPLPAEWYSPLLAEDPSLVQLEERYRLVYGHDATTVTMEAQAVN